MKKCAVLLLLFVFPLLLNSFCFNSHYEGQFKRYRKNRINNKIYYLSGNYYPKIVEAIVSHVEPRFDNAIISIIWKESRFKKNALSKKYFGKHRDYGLTQVSSFYWSFDKKLIFEPYYNIQIGYEIFKYFYKKQNGDIWESFKHYNGSDKYANDVMKIYLKLKKIDKHV